MCVRVRVSSYLSGKSGHPARRRLGYRSAGWHVVASRSAVVVDGASSACPRTGSPSYILLSLRSMCSILCTEHTHTHTRSVRSRAEQSRADAREEICSIPRNRGVHNSDGGVPLVSGRAGGRGQTREEKAKRETCNIGRARDGALLWCCGCMTAPPPSDTGAFSPQLALSCWLRARPGLGWAAVCTRRGGALRAIYGAFRAPGCGFVG